MGIVGHHLPDRGQTAGHTRGIAPRPRRDVGGLRGRLGHDLPDRGHAAMVWRQRRPRDRVATPGRSIWGAVAAITCRIAAKRPRPPRAHVATPGRGPMGHHLPDRGQAAGTAPCPRRDAGRVRHGGGDCRLTLGLG